MEVKSLTIDELKALASEYENKVHDLVREFEKATGIVIADIERERHTMSLEDGFIETNVLLKSSVTFKIVL